MTDLQKPSYSTSKRALWLSSGLAWLVIVSLVGGALTGQRLAVEMASIVVPSMVLLIVAILGVHRGFGSLDMRSMAMGRHVSARPKRRHEVIEEERP